jgi:hypothetical protein
MNLKVELTELHIKKGLSKSYTHDPVCLAIREAVKKQFKIEVKNVMICNQDYGFLNESIFELPEQIKKFINLFDHNKPVMPIVFEIKDLPDDIFTRTRHKR